jgi:AraC family transcriptional regulator of adaptative response/methylated-DNA-[protein]-cysteine methyltransferase
MTPVEYQSGGLDAWIYYATVSTSLGWMLVAGTHRGLCAVEFGDSAEALLQTLRREYPRAQLKLLSPPYPESFRKWIDALKSQVEGHPPRRRLPLDLKISPFQQRVYQFLQSIPCGETRTYGEVAEAIGQPNATRAVGHACAANPVAVAIPCHRVVRAGGARGGYRWGDQRKIMLLDAEKHGSTRLRKLS